MSAMAVAAETQHHVDPPRCRAPHSGGFVLRRFELPAMEAIVSTPL